PTAVADESVTLQLAGHPDLVGTVTEPNAGPLCVKGLSDSGCGTSITVSVPLLNAYPGSYDVVRTQTPAGGGAPTTITKPAGYMVRSKPAITSLSPSTRGQDSSSLVTITGTGFGPGSTVSLGSDVVVSGVTYVNGTTITASVVVPPTAALGGRTLTVTSADNLSATKAAALTVTPSPTLTSLTPAAVLRGTTQTGVTFNGSGLATGGDFAVTIQGVDVTNAVAASDGSKVTADVTVRTTATSGTRTVLLTNADGGRTRLVNGFKVIAPPGAPQAVAVVAGDTKALVGWTAPADPGSSPITSWVVTPSDPSIAPVTVAGNATMAGITGLTNGRSYTFDVVARNADAGAGPKKTTAVVTPKYAVNLSAASNRATAVSGQTAVVYGYLKRPSGAAIAGSTVTLRIVPQSGAATTRPLTTDANGRWSATVPLTYTTSFAGSYAGTADTAARTAPTVLVPVGTRITVTSPVSGTTVGSPFAVRGRVSPNKAGRSVGVYKVVNGSSTLVAKATITSSGTFGASVRLPIGNYLLKVVLGPVGGNSTGTSPQFVVKRR
ncbi:MAG: twitchin, partial [Frankiales bacterium]|nr:twitchin [Frankiales bacterium]